MSIELVFHGANEFVTSEGMVFRSPEGKRMSSLGFNTLDSRYCGNFIKTLTVGGVGTDPEYRRSGAVRQMLEQLFTMAPERGWVVSLLHPFSFSYYRKFGYEKVADHHILEIPMHKLEHFDRCPDLIRVNSPELAEQCTQVYEKFAEKRNIMFRRFGTGVYPTNGDGDRRTYLWYDGDGQPAAYITLKVENEYVINRMVSIHLSVYEMAFTTPESLRALFGFMRMYEGENDIVKIHNYAMSPEVELFIRHYMHTSYSPIPDIAARILDVPAILTAHSYPDEHGHFTVRVEDTLPWTRGVYGVEFQNRKAEVTRLADDANWDLSAEMPAFSQLMYGYDEYSADVVPYMQGVTLANAKSDFFRVFHKMSNGLFEHF